MRATSTLLFFLLSFLNHAQIPEGAGTFPKIRSAKIQSITSLHLTFSDTTETDTMYLEKVVFNKKGQLVNRVFYKRWNCYIAYRYNSRGYLVGADSSGMFGYGYTSMGPDTLYSHVEETWENFDTTSRIYMRKRTIDNWESHVETRFFYDSLGRSTEERSISIGKDISEAFRFSVRYVYTEHSFLLEKQYYSENKLTSKQTFVYAYF